MIFYNVLVIIFSPESCQTLSNKYCEPFQFKESVVKIISDLNRIYIIMLNVTETNVSILLNSLFVCLFV